VNGYVNEQGGKTIKFEIRNSKFEIGKRKTQLLKIQKAWERFSDSTVLRIAVGKPLSRKTSDGI